MLASLIRWTIIIAILIGMPLMGIALNDQSISTYLEFPPLTRHVIHPGFHWWVFGIIAGIDGMMVAVFVLLLRRAHQKSARPITVPRARFPAWGWIGAGIMSAGWWLAWTRHGWFAPLQHHTFCLPWLGYILLTNAWCHQRSGTCLVKEAFNQFLLLFPVSAVFWWYFEFLNRIVQNWFYVGVDQFGPIEYTLFASLAFATVLPAVLSTYRLLLTLPLFNTGLKNIGHWSPSQISRFTALSILVASAFCMALISRYPNYLFPLIWVAPLLVITAVQALWKQETIVTPLINGDWRAILASALAALICGFFWELWNHHSLARWVYALPFVDRYHIFAMPVLGYGGYLPFGVECLAVGRFVVHDHYPEMD